MDFEEQVTSLCARAIAAKDDAEAQKLIAELQGTLHNRIEELRSGLLRMYRLPSTLAQAAEKAEHAEVERTVELPAERPGALSFLRTWIKVALEVASERSNPKKLQLRQELDHTLQDQVGEKPA